MTIARLTAAVSVFALASGVRAEEPLLAPLENFGKVVVTAKQSTGAISFEQAFGGEFDAEPASDYPESSELRRLGRAVGRLDVAFSKGVGYCTAFLISDQYLMTNAHCLEGGQVQAIKFITGYIETGVEEGTRIYDVGAAPVEISASGDLDFAILRVFGNPASEWGTLDLAAVEIDETRDAGMPLIVLGHPYFTGQPEPQALRISRKECRATDSKPLASNRLRHTCDTLNGNSGSPVFSDDTRKVIALHHAGSPREGINFAVPITLIAQKSKVVADLLALAPAPDEGSAALAAQLAAAQAELERLRQQSAAAEAERTRLAEEAARLAAAKTEAERLAREMAEAERQKLLDQLAVLKAEQDRAKTEKARKAEPDSVRFPGSYWEKTVRSISGHFYVINSAAFSPDGARIVTASDNTTARVWDALSGQAVTTLSGHVDKVYQATFSPDGSRIVTASGDDTAWVWDALSGKVLVKLSGHKGPVFGAGFSLDGSRIVTASLDKTARVWDSTTGELLLTLSGHDDYVSSAAFSPDGTWIVTSSGDKTAKVWDAGTGQSIKTLSGHGDKLWHATVSPDGTRIVTASSDRNALVWDAATGRVLASFSGHRSSVLGAAFSPDGTLVVTASSDKTARVWVAKTGQLVATLSGHGDSLYTAEFSPDGSQIVTASKDKTARIWGGY